MKKAFLIVVLVLVLVISGCVGSGGGQATRTHSTSFQASSPSPTETASTTSSHSENPKGIRVVEIFNRTFAVNASLVPEETFACAGKSPGVIKAYYSAVKNEEDVTGYFDSVVVDIDSVRELHDALYKAVDFEKLDVSKIKCYVVSVNLTACTYHYSATIVSGNERKNIEKDYVTFLSGSSCKIVWMEVEG
ncbi:hypothetical protein [Thermococcus sp.]